MLHVPEILTDSPDIHNQANKGSHTDDDIIGIIIITLPYGHSDLKNNKSQKQLQEEFLLESKVEEQDNERSIEQIIDKEYLVV